MRLKHILPFIITILAFVTELNAQAYGGYTLYSKMGNTKTYLLDANGNTYHQWTVSPGTGYSCYLLPGQILLRSAVNSGNQLSGAAMCGKVQKVAWDGTILWNFTYSSSTYCTHHDICPMPNGNVLLISYDVRTAAQAAAAGASANITVWAEKIVEVQPTGPTTGNIVWEWKVWDHLVQNTDPAKPNYGLPVNNPGRFHINQGLQKDWLHMNGIDYNAALDQIVISSHNWSEIFVIDHSTTTAEAATSTGGNSGKGGDILYRWGNPQNYGAGTSANKILKVCHDAHWIPDGSPNAGYLACFNNQGGSSNGSCVDMVNPPVNGYTYNQTAGSAFTPLTYDYRHACLGNASNMSNSEQFPNGNLLVCIATSGYMYEVTPTGTVVWSKTVGGSVAQAHRYTEAYVNGAFAAATATPASICAGAASQLNVTASSGTNFSYTWSSDPSGFSSTLQNPLVSPTETTVYSVTVYSSTDTLTTTVTVTVNPSPDTPLITLNGNSLLSSATSANQWYLNGTLISGATGQSYTPLTNGLYTVQVSQNGCTATSLPYAITNVGMEEEFSETLHVYPNPVSDILYLEGAVPASARISVTDARGAVILESGFSESLDISGLCNGVYLLGIRDSGMLLSMKRIIVQH